MAIMISSSDFLPMEKLLLLFANVSAEVSQKMLQKKVTLFCDSMMRGKKHFDAVYENARRTLRLPFEREL